MATSPRVAVNLRPRPEALRTAAVIAAGLVLVCVYSFPGYMAYDSWEQLEQARAGQLTDWHPPLMSALWGVLDHVVRGPLLMLLLQCGLFLGGLYALLRRWMSERRAAIATLVIFVFPPSLTMMGVVLKDSLMAGALLCGCAGLTSKQRGAQVASLAAFLLAAGLRHNAISVVVPLIAVLSPWPATKGPWVRGAVGAAIALALTGSAVLINRGLTDVETHPFHQSVAPMDIVGTLTWAPDLTDDEVRALMPGVKFAPASGLQAHARRIYDVNKWWGAHTRGDERLFDDPTTPELRAGITDAWWRMIKTYPGAYLSGRLDMMRELIGFTSVRWTPVYEARNEEAMLRNTGQPPANRNVVQRWLAKRMLKLGYTSVIFRPYLYLILALGLIVIFRRDRVMLALLVSGFTYLGMLLVVSPAPDFRYIHWTIIVAMIAVAVRFLGVQSARALPVHPRST